MAGVEPISRRPRPPIRPDAVARPGRPTGRPVRGPLRVTTGQRRLAGELHRVPDRRVPGRHVPAHRQCEPRVGAGVGGGHVAALRDDLGVDDAVRRLARHHVGQPLACLRHDVGVRAPASQVRLQLLLARLGRAHLRRQGVQLLALGEVRPHGGEHHRERQEQHDPEQQRPDREQPGEIPAPLDRSGDTAVARDARGRPHRRLARVTRGVATRRRRRAHRPAGARGRRPSAHASIVPPAPSSTVPGTPVRVAMVLTRGSWCRCDGCET